MKKIILIIIIFLLQVIYSYSQSTWFNTFTNNSNFIYSILPRDDNTYFAFTNNNKSYLKTTNNGQVWSINKLLDSTISIGDGQFINNQTGWIVGYYDNNSIYAPYLFKTVNGGLNWINQEFNFPSSRLLSVKFINDNTGFVGGAAGITWNGFISKTTNGGSSWNLLGTPSTSSIRRIIFIDDLTGWIGGNTIYRTTDCGLTWNNMTSNSPISGKIILNFYTLNGIKVWVSCDAYYPDLNGYIYYSSNSGSNWELAYTYSTVSGSGYRQFNNILFVDDNTGYLSGNAYLYSDKCILKTTNGGYNWFVSEGLQFDAYSMCYYNNMVLVGGGQTEYSEPDQNFILKSTDDGSNWSQFEYNWDYTFSDIHFSDINNGLAYANYMAMYGGNHNKIFKTSNKGIDWIQVYQNDSIQFGRFAFANNYTGFINISNSRLLRTTNYGNNWDIIQLSNGINLAKFINQSTCWASSGDIMIKSTDMGLNWISYDIPDISTYTISDFSFINESMGWILAYKPIYIPPYFTYYNTSILKTSNGGLNWQLKFHLEQQSYTYSSFKFFDENNGIMPSGNKFLKTTNGGSNWFDDQLNFNINASRFYMINSNTGWIFGSTDGLSKTTNGGHNWFSQFSAYNTTVASLFSIDSNNVWFGSNHSGLYNTTNGGGIISAIVENENNKILKYNLFQNYPNPFNPITKIKYQISKINNATLTVYDILGKTVKILVNQRQSPGVYEVTFDGSNLSSGIYFYQLRTGDFVETKKMILLK